MCSMSLLCPLCAQTNFSSIDALRCSLIKAANGPLSCPICHELFLGLDKLTIHLFSHTTNLINNIALQEETPTSINKIANATLGHSSSSFALRKENEEKQLDLELNYKNIPQSLSSAAVVKQRSQQKNEQEHRAEDEEEEEEELMTGLNTDENLATCDICEFTFRNQNLRDMHIKLVHQNLPPQYATLQSSCNINNTENDINSEQLNGGLDFKCHLCAKTFKMKGSLRVHLKVVHLVGLPYGNSTNKLNICDRIRLKAINITQTKFNNSNKQSSAPILIRTPPSNTSNFNHNRYQGENASIVFQPFPNLQLAQNISSICPRDNSLESESESRVNSNPDSDSIMALTQNHESKELQSKSNNCNNSLSSLENPKIWDCEVCSKSFTTKYFLKKHKRLHTGEMPYTCEICARTFTFQQSYHKHLLYHSDEKPHVCHTCGRAFKELSTLHNHERIHSGEKPFKCEVCGKCFRQRVSFLVHTRIHTGVMPYKCELCQKSFRYKVSQRTHKCQSSNEDGNKIATTLDDISENFIKAFLEENSSVATSSQRITINNTIFKDGGETAHFNHLQNSPTSAEITEIIEKRQDVLLPIKIIDEMVAESCQKLGITANENCKSASDDNSISLSPTQQLQNMRLYSPQLIASDLNAFESDLTRFLLDSSESGASVL
ncbi:uncharacterized protein ACN427_008327 [Glossina fuscipes fuscipes]